MNAAGMSELRAPPPRALVGLIGSGIQRSLTPAMHEEEARHHGLRLHYQLIDLDTTGSTVDALPGLMQAARTMALPGSTSPTPASRP